MASLITLLFWSLIAVNLVQLFPKKATTLTKLRRNLLGGGNTCLSSIRNDMSKIRYTEFFGKGKGFKKESICPSQKIFVEHYCDGTCQLTLHYITDKVHTQRGWHVCQYISVNPLDFLQHVPARPLSQIIYVHTNL